MAYGVEPYEPDQDGFYWVIDPSGNWSSLACVLRFYDGNWYRDGEPYGASEFLAISTRLEEPQ